MQAQNSDRKMTEPTANASPSVQTPPPTPVLKIKKPRSEAQLQATAYMKRKRVDSIKEMHLASLAQQEEENEASLRLFEESRKKKRKEKHDEFDNLIAKRFDQYHERLMKDLQQPISTYLESYAPVKEVKEVKDVQVVKEPKAPSKFASFF